MRETLKNIQNFLRQAVKLDVSGAHPYRDKPFLLLTGLGRSGTTAVRNLVAAHPGGNTKNSESNTLFDYLQLVERHRNHPNRVQNLAVDRDGYLELVGNMLLHMHWPKPQCEDGWPEFISTFSVTNPDTCEAFKEVFPQSRFCYILRNGIEVISSRMKFGAPPFSKLTFEQHCDDWASRALAMLQWAETRDDVFIFRQEWLLDPSSAEAALARLFPGIAADVATQMLHSISSSSFNPTRFDNESGGDRADLSQRSRRFELWTDSQRQYFRETCGQTMEMAGYTIPGTE